MWVEWEIRPYLYSLQSTTVALVPTTAALGVVILLLGVIVHGYGYGVNSVKGGVHMSPTSLNFNNKFMRMSRLMFNKISLL